MGEDLREEKNASHAPHTSEGAFARTADAPAGNSTWNGSVRLARRAAVAVIGGTVVAIGLIMVVTPGPAVVVIPAGLAILAVEFEFARRWLRAMRERARRIASRSADSGDGAGE
jgi:hypothetical protein